MRPQIIAISMALSLAGCVGGMGGAMHGGGMGGRHQGGMEARHQHMMGGMGPMVGCPGEQQDVEQRLASLRASLAITSAQEPAWTAYADAYRQHAGAMHMGPMTHHAGSLPERMQHHETMMTEHLSSMRALRTSVEGLYAVLSDAQKAQAEALACEMRRR